MNGSGSPFEYVGVWILPVQFAIALSTGLQELRGMFFFLFKLCLYLHCSMGIVSANRGLLWV